MATQIFSNDASALLAATINATDLTIQVASGFGTLFPSPGAGEFFLVTLQNAAGDREIVKISSRTGDNLTVDDVADRGLEDTSAAAWTLNVTRVELRETAETLDRFVQQEAGVVTMDLTIPNLEVSGSFEADSGAITGAFTVAGVSVRSASIINSGVFSVGRLGGGTLNANTYLAGDGDFKTVAFTQLSGSASNAQVLQAAVTQHQAALSIASSQVTGTKTAAYISGGTFADALVALSNVSQHAASIKTRNITGAAGVAVTVQSDPGGTPSGSPGDVFEYY